MHGASEVLRIPEGPRMAGRTLGGSHKLNPREGLSSVSAHPAKGDSDRFPIETDSPTIIPVPGDPTTEREGAHRQIGYECRHT